MRKITFTEEEKKQVYRLIQKSEYVLTYESLEIATTFERGKLKKIIKELKEESLVWIEPGYDEEGKLCWKGFYG